MRNALRSWFLATVLFSTIAVAPLVIEALGYHLARVADCTIDAYEPKPVPRCEDDETMRRLSALTDAGVYAVFTVPFAGPFAAVSALRLAVASITTLKRRQSTAFSNPTAKAP